MANEGGDIEKKRKELESCKQILAETKRKKDEYLVSRATYLPKILLSQHSQNAVSFLVFYFSLFRKKCNTRTSNVVSSMKKEE